MASVFCSYAVFVLLGYLKDVEADRATGYVTLPVRFGRRATVVVSPPRPRGVAPPRLLLARGGRRGASRPARVALWAAGAAGLLARAPTRGTSAATRDARPPGVAVSVRASSPSTSGEAALLLPASRSSLRPSSRLFEVALLSRPCREQV